MIKKILVGIDGSEGSLKAASYAADLASLYGATITLMYVAPNSVDVRSSGKATYVPNKTITVGDKFDLARNIMDKKKVAYDIVAKMGNAAQILVKQSENDYNLLVVGKRGISGIHLLLMGSVSSHIVRHSKVPTLIVP
jgi:nucleotide-binding universal stress UspA family protein